ncbi:hypothetical protein OGAPHI_007356 [Ogataea philodendri]|uniref:EamA domain-containing protein n=1 Tax=Ogataea philodendri TaxID=1378263 RepID=A0A9P8SZ88_9ASCO|nr:uncharacterized protein OGAPHI_007356 [Ogataea philodendri]KAH3660151.1 hypothetical protein OGAPHI_007356 [Ogataea philodendri]
MVTLQSSFFGSGVEVPDLEREVVGTANKLGVVWRKHNVLNSVVMGLWKNINVVEIWLPELDASNLVCAQKPVAVVAVLKSENGRIMGLHDGLEVECQTVPNGEFSRMGRDEHSARVGHSLRGPAQSISSLEPLLVESNKFRRQSRSSAGLVPEMRSLRSMHEYSFSYVKIVFVVVLFVTSLISFVTQTETTAYLYTELKFSEPILLLLITHGSWWLLWPLQFSGIALYKTFRRYLRHKNGYIDPHGKKWKGFRRAFTSSVKTQHKNIFHSAELTIRMNRKDYEKEFGSKSFKHFPQFFKSQAIKYIFKSTLILSVILNAAGITWYIAMGMSTGSDVTAIYNCSAFTAYMFAIPILGEKLSLVKLSSVVTAIAGVMVVAYSGKNQNLGTYPHRLQGDVIILMGAILYGLYEVLYKKMCCPPSNEVSARRQATFSNFSMCLIGINTVFVVIVPMAVVQILGWHRFQFPTSSKQWLYIFLSTFSNLIFSVSFLALMALTSPVFSSVASLVTILIVGLVEWFLWGIAISVSQMLGYLLVVAGFGLLTYASWSEISEEDTADELIDTDTESVVSTN